MTMSKKDEASADIRFSLGVMSMMTEALRNPDLDMDDAGVWADVCSEVWRKLNHLLGLVLDGMKDEEEKAA